MIVRARTCRHCGDPCMKPRSREWTGMETTVTYVCPTCDKSIGLNALSHAGMMSALGLIVLSIVAGVMMNSPSPWRVSDYVVYGLVLAGCVYVPGNILYPHWRYPISRQTATTARVIDFVDNTFTHYHRDPIRRRIIKFERHGFWRGFFTPILFIIIVLAVATAIGLLNFYVFQSL